MHSETPATPQGVVGVVGNAWQMIYMSASQLANLSGNPSQLPTELSSYAQAGYPISYTAVANPITINTYDGNGNLSSKTIGSDVVGYSYDDFNRILVTTTHQNGVLITATNTYDVNGNLIAQTDGAGHTTLYAYGAFNQLQSKTVGNAAQAGGQIITTYSYNQLNQETDETNNLGENIAQGWDNAGHLLSTNDAVNGFTVTVQRYHL